MWSTKIGGGAVETRNFSDGTSVTVRMPWSLYVSARVLCPDGKIRKTKRIAQTADTFFSVPCAVYVNGKTVAGYMTVETRAGLSTATESDPAVVKFFPFKYRKNGDAFDSCAEVSE